MVAELENRIISIETQELIEISAIEGAQKQISNNGTRITSDTSLLKERT